MPESPFDLLEGIRDVARGLRCLGRLVILEGEEAAGVFDSEGFYKLLWLCAEDLLATTERLKEAIAALHQEIELLKSLGREEDEAERV